MVRDPNGPEAAVERLIEFALTTVGWSDENNTKATPAHTWYNEKFGNPTGEVAWAWCDGWLTYVAWKTGNEKAVVFNTGYAYTPSHVNAFKQKGLWTNGASGVRRGDIVFFDWEDDGEVDHVGIVTGVRPDGTLDTVEGNTLNVVAQRNRLPKDVAGYGRPVYGGTTTTPPPTQGGGTEVPTQYTPPAFPAGLAPNLSKPSARGLQAALKAAGYMSKSVAAADNYGPATQAAVAQFHRQHPALSSDSYDPEIGPEGWKVLHMEAYGGQKPPSKPVTAPPATDTSAREPAGDYRRVTYGGKTVNVRTKTMLDRARGLLSLGGQFTLTQGSYNRGVSASAGTHDGGGVVDINTSGLNVNASLRALRQAGFAAWYRTPAEGFSYHIHACAIGDREMASGARSQVAAYFAGRNGLASNRADTAPASVGRPYPAWAAKYR